ncbi:MAG: quinone-dependent dihydroorotate dehydrogenase [Bacteroidia bacterium]|nr:quinone-dependent dihydroorotate dehydrogenase [Bacteroidia bacterium]
MYKQFIRPLVFCSKPEKQYKCFLRLVRFAHSIFGPHLIRFTHRYESPALGRELFGLKFKNPVGLAAGFDVNGEFVNDMADYGFSFVEIGSLSSTPQNGFDKPKVVRLRKDKAVIGRTGGKNKGVKQITQNIEGRYENIILAASIIPNGTSHKDEEMIKDYETAFSLFYDFADMFTVNISMPNESGVLTVEDTTSLADVMDPLLDLRLCYDKYKPILIKVSPDIPYEQLDAMLDYCMLSGVDGVIAGGPTRKRDGLTCNVRKIKGIPLGGLSGAPLFKQNLALVKHISEHTKGRFPIIACGGIMKPEQAVEMLSAGASLIQLQTGIIYEGPKLVKKTLKRIVSNPS